MPDQNSVLITTFMQNREALSRFMALRCGTDDAQDLTQELWIKVQQVEAQVDAPLAYLYRMAHRLVLDTRRGASRCRDRDHAWTYAQGGLEPGQHAVAERQLLAKEQLNQVERTLASLGGRALRVFTRYRIDGVEQRRIALELGISISTVEKDLRRSYAALARLHGNIDEV